MLACAWYYSNTFVVFSYGYIHNKFKYEMFVESLSHYIGLWFLKYCKKDAKRMQMHGIDKSAIRRNRKEVVDQTDREKREL